MLLEMRFNNFFSVKDEVCIDFKAANINTKNTKELVNNIFKANDETLLKVLGLFGPNASGKTSILKAAMFCRQLVIDSHMNNEGSSFNFVPFKFEGFSEKPSVFFIDFIIEGIEYEYSFALNKKRVLKEELYYYPGKRKAKIFTRDETAGKSKSEIYSFGEGQFSKPMDVAESTGKMTLFVSRASSMNREIAQKIYNYFRKELQIGLPLLSGKYALGLFNQHKKLILQALKMADSDITDIEAKIEKATVPVQFPFGQINQNIPLFQTIDVIKFYTSHKKDENIKFELETEESNGTKQIFNLLLILLDICKKGKTLLIDEFDASLHTELAQFVLDMVNASENAQFLFTSHNTNLLDMKKLRRDQIMFANKKEDGSTEIYSLFDFKDFRENMDAAKCYLQGRFDAVPYTSSSLSAIKNMLGNN